MNLTSDFPYWLLRNGLRQSYPSLDRDLSCHVLVVGGGITGAILADRFSSEGMETLLIDRRDIGTGSTSASTAMLQYEIDVSLDDLKRLIGDQAAERAYRLSHDSIDQLESLASSLDHDVGFQRKTSIYIAADRATASGLAHEARARQPIGLDVEYHDADDVRSRFGLDRVAALSTTQAASCDPHRFAHALIERASRRGALVFDRTSIACAEFDGQSTTVKTDRGHSIRTTHIVYATGYESQTMLKEKVVDLDNTYALVSEPLVDVSPWNADWLLWEAKTPYLYLRITDDKRLLVGGEDDSFHNPARRDRSIKAKSVEIERKVRELIPDLRWEPAYEWAGTFGKTRDGLAYIGPSDEFPGALFALCFGGNGITFSVIAADVLTASLTSGSSDDACLFRFGR